MGILILLIIISAPIAEIAVFIKIGGQIGVWSTLGITFLTAIIGTFLVRLQGLSTLKKVQKSLALNQFPLTEVFDGFCLLIAGAFLLIPGFITDSIGLILFIPMARKLLRHLIKKHLISSNQVHMQFGAKFEFNDKTQDIEGEFHEITPENKRFNNSKKLEDKKSKGLKH